MTGRNIGETLVSVADVKMLDAKTKVEIGEATALTSSGIESTIQNVEVSGGYLNALLFDVRFGRRLNITLENPTFKMEYLAYQTGNPITRALRDVYAFNDCHMADSTTVELNKEPTGTVHLTYEDGSTQDVTAVGKNITVDSGRIGTKVSASYFYGGEFENVQVDNSAEPMTVTLLMNIHSRKQDGSTGMYQINIPLFKFDGNFNLACTSDGVSAMSIAGTSLAYTSVCGKSKYCDFTYLPDDEDSDLNIMAITGAPNKITLSGANVTPTIVAVRQAPYENFIITDGLSFTSEDDNVASVDGATGEITAVGGTGETTDINVSYNGFTCKIAITIAS